MPKTLFYAGVIFALLVAVLATVEAGNVLMNRPGAIPGISAPAASTLVSSPFHLVAALVMIVPLAALFLRLASLDAARNLFGAFASVFVVSCATVSVAGLALVRLRAAGLLGSQQSDLRLGDLDLVGWYLAGLFLSLAILATRPYFGIRAPLVGAAVCLPLPFYFGALVERVFGGIARRELAVAYFVSTALSLTMMSAHAIRHRHRLLETTNLRGLLLPPRGSATPEGRDRFGLDGDVAFDGR